MKRLLTLLISTTLLITQPACGLFGTETGNPAKPTLVGQMSQITYSEPSDVLAFLKNKAKEKLNSKISELQYGEKCGEPEEYGVDPSAESDSDGSSSLTPSDVDFTDTNLQETDVDEADIIKTNGSYIYVATSSGVDIFKAWPVEEFTKVGSYSIPDGADDLFLSGNKLIVLSSTGVSYDTSMGDFDYYYYSAPADYKTQILILDITTPASPTLLDSRTVESSYVQARLVDGVVHMVLSEIQTHFELTFPENFEARYEEAECGSTELNALIDEVETQNLALIETKTLEELAPQTSDGVTSTSVSSSSFSETTQYSRSEMNGLWSLSVGDTNITNEKLSIVLGPKQSLYASTQSVYLAARANDADATNIHRFSIDSENLHTYAGSGQVPGHIDNVSLVGSVESSFLMSESENILRIATTVGEVDHYGTSDVYNNVYTLDTSNSDLTIIGRLEEIARTEQIYAARFFGDRGYLVTFEKIDPLFIIDVSDPTNPEILGELEMPGFSSYLHLLDADHLIGIGKDAEDAGTFSWYQGLKLSIFDVENGASPSTVDDLIIGDRGTDSYALTDHHAFTFDYETGMLALPLEFYDGSTGGSDYGDFQYYGIHLYNLSADSGITEKGVIELTDSTSTPKRTVLFNDGETFVVYILDAEKLYLYNTTTLEKINEAELTTE